MWAGATEQSVYRQIATGHVQEALASEERRRHISPGARSHILTLIDDGSWTEAVNEYMQRLEGTRYPAERIIVRPVSFGETEA